MNIIIALLLSVLLKRLTVFNGTLPGCGNHHSLGHTAQFCHDRGAEMLHDHLHALGNVGLVQFHKAGDLPLRLCGLTPWIFFDFLIDLIEGIVCRIVLQHIQNKAFLNGLLHGIHMEGLTLALAIQPPKQHDRGWFGCSGEREDGYVGLLTVTADLIGNHVFRIREFLLASAKRLRNCCHVLTGGRGMRLVDDDREGLVLQAFHAVHDIGELLNGRGDDFCIAVQRHGQIRRVAFIVHHANQARFMFHAHDGFLQLPVNDHSVCDDNHVIKDDLIVSVVQ